jgi:hypothetical protein
LNPQKESATEVTEGTEKNQQKILATYDDQMDTDGNLKSQI